MRDRQRGGCNRFAAAVESRILRRLHWLPWVHATMFVAFVLVILVPPFLPEPEPESGPLDHLALFSNVALWGVWFPLLLVSVIFTGRSWCGLLCPMGAASEAASLRGLRLPVPRWLSWPGTPIVSFAVVTVLGQTTGVRSHPEAVALIFGGTMAAAILLGWLYAPGKRPWCRHGCPIGLLLGVFSRLGMVDLAPKRPRPGGDRIDRRGVCPTMIDLKRKTEQRHCIACFRCVSPRAKGGLYLDFRRPGEEIEGIGGRNANLSEVMFLLLGGGLALGGFLWNALSSFARARQAIGEWSVDRELTWLLEPGPSWLMSVHPERREVLMWLDFIMISTFMLAVMIIVAGVLSLAALTAAAIAGRLGARGTLGRRFVELGYQFAPVAMVSLVIGLGGGVFVSLKSIGLSAAVVAGLKYALFAGGTLWSVFLADRILAAQGLGRLPRMPALAPGLAGSLALAAAWFPALF